MSIFDMLLANAMGESGGGGGGGSSDFSTAQVTMICTASSEFTLYGAFGCEEDQYYEGASAGVYPLWIIDNTTNVTVKVPMYQSVSQFLFNSPPESDNCEVVTTGDVKYDSEQSAINVTGDGSFTVQAIGG